MGIRETLTSNQKETMDFIKSYISNNKVSPLITEIQEHFKLKSLRSVTQRLDSLEKKGLLQRDRFKHRSISIINTDQLSNKKKFFQMIPVIASVGCDQMSIYAQERFDEYLDVESSMIGNHKDVYAFKAVGNSMVDAGVQNGDYILVEQTEHAESGDRVVAIVGEMAVLKLLQKTDDAVILRPEAKGYNPIVLNENFKIFGKFIRTIQSGLMEDDIQFVYDENIKN
jgi:repressor LexA